MQCVFNDAGLRVEHRSGQIRDILLYRTDRRQSTLGLRLTRFTGGQGPHRLGADLPHRPSPLQLLRVSAGWGFARGSHRLKTQIHNNAEVSAEI